MSLGTFEGAMAPIPRDGRILAAGLAALSNPVSTA